MKIGNTGCRASNTYARLQHKSDSCYFQLLLEDLGTFSLKGISWVIVGGESGPGARPMAKEWVLSIRDLCRESQVPFFFKQWGGVRKSETGRTLI